MAKAITKTTTKISTTHNRVAIVVKYPNGEIFKTASNRGSDTMSVARPTHMTDKLDMNPVFKFVMKSISPQETVGERFERLEKFFENTNSIQHMIDMVKAK